MSDQDIVVTLADEADIVVTVIQDSITLVEIESSPSEVAVDTITLDGVPGVKGDRGESGPEGPRGIQGPSGQLIEPEIADLTLLFENQLI